MARYTLKPQVSNTVTFKCVTCGKRDIPERAYNLTVSACSEECFDGAFNYFMGANDYKAYGVKQMKDLINANPIPLY